MPVSGLVRLRRHLFGRQASFGTKVPATRAYPYSGVPDHNLNWTDPEIDSGSIDPVAPPTRQAPELTFDGDIPALYYDDIPQVYSGFFGGGVTPSTSGTSKSWPFDPASETIDDPDPYTYQFGDDRLDDWFQYGDGIIEDFEFNAPEGLGQVTGSASWRFGSIASTGSTDSPVTGTVPTPGLSVDKAGVPVYLKDCTISIGDDPDYLTPILRAVHSFVFRGTHEIDEKRWADGDQSFDADELVPGARELELELTLAKTDDTVGVGSESDDWMSDVSVNRYIKFRFLSTQEASTGIFYEWSNTMPMRYYTRTEGEVGGNSVIVLTAHAFFDPDYFEGVLNATIVNKLASL